MTTPASSLVKSDPLGGAFGYQDSTEMKHSRNMSVSSAALSKRSTKLVEKVSDKVSDAQVDFSGDEKDLDN